jgi:prepilin-type processing-associated H-X9-DG protein
MYDDGATVFVVANSLTDFILLADSVFEMPGDSGHRKQCYFVSDGWGNRSRIHLRHNGRANVLFGDGHVTSLNEPELRANLGWAPGLGIDAQVP